MREGEKSTLNGREEKHVTVEQGLQKKDKSDGFRLQSGLRTYCMRGVLGEKTVSSV